MKTFRIDIDWDSPVIAQQMLDALKDNNFVDEKGDPLVSLSLGFSDCGKTAFIVTGYKSKSAIRVHVENENMRIKMAAGLLPKYTKKPQFEKTFKHTELKQASEYFEMLLGTVGMTNE